MSDNKMTKAMLLDHVTSAAPAVLTDWSRDRLASKIEATEARERATMIRVTDGSVEAWRSMLAHNAGTVSGLVGEDAAEGGWATWHDYAVAIGTGDGVVSRLRLQGRAIVVHGVEPGSPLWSKVTKVARMTGGAKVLRAYVDADEPCNLWELEEALDAHINPPPVQDGEGNTLEEESGEESGTESGEESGEGDSLSTEVRAYSKRLHAMVALAAKHADADTLRALVEMATAIGEEAQTALAEVEAAAATA